MRFKKVIRCENGNFTFDGELSPDELDFILGVGMACLLDESFDMRQDDLDFDEPPKLN